MRKRDGPAGEPLPEPPLPDDDDLPEDACCRSRRKPYVPSLAKPRCIDRRGRSALADVSLIRRALREVKRRAVDAVAKPGRSGAVGKDMAEVDRKSNRLNSSH